MTQILYLLRHAKAEPWTPGCDDFSRVLSNRGRRHMGSLAGWMQGELPEPDAVLCSTSARTRETLDPLFASWPELAARTHYLDAIYEATTGGLHALVEQAFEQVDSLLMVGHNPGFEHLALSILCDADARQIAKMATGTLGVFEFEQGYREDAGQGQLRHWITRKQFD